MKLMEKISDLLDKACGAVIVFMIGAMVLITTAQIICRTWFTALSWSDEVTRYLLIWSTFLGATCVYKSNGNIAITFVQDLLPGNSKKIMRMLVHLICMVLFAVLFWYACQYTTHFNKTATTLPIKMKYIFLCVPISMCISFYHALVLLIKEALTKNETEGGTEK